MRRPDMPEVTSKTLRARDAKRDIGAELLESVRQMKRGELRVVFVPPGDSPCRSDLVIDAASRSPN